MELRTEQLCHPLGQLPFPHGGGHPAEPVRTLKPLPGVYTEQLLAEIRERGLPLPPFYGLPMDNMDKTNEEIIADFDAFLETQMGR